MNIPALYITLAALYFGGHALRRALDAVTWRPKHKLAAKACDLVVLLAPALVQGLAGVAAILATYQTALDTVTG